MSADQEVTESFLGQLGFQIRVEGDTVSGELEMVPEFFGTGTATPRVSLIATAADVLLGMLANAHLPGLPLTAELSADVLATPTSRRVRMIGTLVKLGRTLTSAEARFVDDNEVLVSYAWATFVSSPRPDDVTVPSSNGEPFRFEPTITRPFFELLGLQQTAPGVVEAARRPDLFQATETFQGGVVCAAGELAATSLLGSTITSIDTRYLSAVRAGALRATASALGANSARVEVVDADRPDRVAAVMHCRHGVIPA